jgi:hypothetical protein
MPIPVRPVAIHPEKVSQKITPKTNHAMVANTIGQITIHNTLN